MYKKMPAILKRTMWAKSLGWVVSLIWFLAFIWGGYYADNVMIAWGILLWYPTVGAMIGLAGVMDEHPLLWKMGIWRGIMLGAMMNFILVLFAAEALMDIAIQAGYEVTTSFMIWGSLLEGAIIWGAIDWYVTAKFGEGKKLMKK